MKEKSLHWVHSWFLQLLTEIKNAQYERYDFWIYSGAFVLAVQWLNWVQLFATQWTAAPQAPLSSTVSQNCSNSCPLSWWYYLTILLSSATPFSFCFQSFPASGSFPMSRLFASSCQNIGASALATVLLINSPGWFPLGLAGLISLLFRGLFKSLC